MLRVEEIDVQVRVRDPEVEDFDELIVREVNLENGATSLRIVFEHAGATFVVQLNEKE